MKKGNDDNKDLDFSEFDEEMDNTATNKLKEDEKPEIDDSVFSGDFDFDSDDIPVLTDVVADSQQKDDFDEFEFEDSPTNAKPTENPSDSTDEVFSSDFNFEEPQTDSEFEFSNDNVSLEDLDLDFETMSDDTTSINREAPPVSDDDFDFDVLENNSQDKPLDAVATSKDDDFDFSELDMETDTPVRGTLEVTEGNEEFDFDMLDMDKPDVTPPTDNTTDFNLDDDFNAPTAISDSNDFNFEDDIVDDSVNNVNPIENNNVSDFEEIKSDETFDFNQDDNKPSDDDFDFSGVNNDSTQSNTDFDFEDATNNDFEEILEKDIAAVLEPADTFNLDDSQKDDFDFMNDDKVDEPKDIVNNDIYDNKSDKGISDMTKKDDYDFDDGDFNFDENNGKASSNKNDVKNNSYDNDDFDFGNDNKSDDFDTTFNLEDNDKDDFDFGNPKDEHADFDVNDKSHDDTSDEIVADKRDDFSDEPKVKKPISPIIKYSALALAISLLGGGGFFAYTNYFTSSFEETEEQAPAPKKVKAEKATKEVKEKEKPKAVVKEEKVTDLSSELAGLDDMGTTEPVKSVKKSTELKQDIQIPVNNAPVVDNSKLAQDYEKLEGQFATVIGSVSKMSNELDAVKSENARMKDLLNKVKNDNSSAEFESFQLDFSTLKNEVAGLKEQVIAEKSFNKETMIKFLTISKKLKEEVTNLKSSQVSKEEVAAKLQEISDLSKQVEILNSKVSNTEVMSKIATLEKSMNDKKLQEVETQLNKNKTSEAAKSNKNKSVLELLEERNKEKDLEKNTVVIEEEDDLKVPLSVTIEEESAEDERPVVKKQTVKKKVKNEYYLIGTIEGTVYLKNSSGTPVDYRVGDQLPGYGSILKIYKDGSVETESGNVKFKEK